MFASRLCQPCLLLPLLAMLTSSLQDKINAFWEITKKDLEDKKAEMRNQDRQTEEADDMHQRELKVSTLVLGERLILHHRLHCLQIPTNCCWPCLQQPQSCWQHGNSKPQAQDAGRLSPQ